MREVDPWIEKWRRELAATGLRDEELLAELESHLRDEIEHQLSTGTAVSAAFDSAVAQIGPPTALHGEFDKLGVFHPVQQKAKRALLTLAGIPQSHFNTVMNSSVNTTNIEPAWATYFKNSAFAGPAILLWAASAVFVLPKLEQICRDAGLGGDFSLWRVTHSNFAAMQLFREYGIFFIVAVTVIFALLEWRSVRWPRYRRVTLGMLAFGLNLIVLLSVFVMIITATAAAPALLQHAR